MSAISDSSSPAQSLPDVVYHGTNIIAAVRILNDGQLKADYPVDGEMPVVCVTSMPEVARCFAVEFIRHNSSHEVGVVFTIDGKSLSSSHVYEAHEAETASFDEGEFRVEGDLPIGIVTGVQCVGETKNLQFEDYLEHLWEEHCSDIPFVRFHELVQALAAGDHKLVSPAPPSRSARP